MQNIPVHLEKKTSFAFASCSVVKGKDIISEIYRSMVYIDENMALIWPG